HISGVFSPAQTHTPPGRCWGVFRGLFVTAPSTTTPLDPGPILHRSHPGRSHPGPPILVSPILAGPILNHPSWPGRYISRPARPSQVLPCRPHRLRVDVAAHEPPRSPRRVHRSHREGTAPEEGIDHEVAWVGEVADQPGGGGG